MLMMADVDLGLHRPSTLTLGIRKKLLVVIGEAGIGSIPATIPPITEVTMLDCCVYLLILVDSCCVDDSIHENVRGGSRG